MNPDWKSFLNQTGAVLDNDRVLHFGDINRELQAAISSEILCDLSHQGLITAVGPDTENFLQGQLTNDIRQVTLESSQLSAHCNPKGRMLTCFRIFRRADIYYLRLSREIIETILRRMRMYVLAADTALGDASDDLVGIGLSGPNAETILKTTLGTASIEVDDVIHTDAISMIRLPGIHPRFEIYGEPKALTALWNNLAPQTNPAGTEPWRLLDILAGIPNVYTETMEAFVPQMANLDLLDGVNFRKGCYTGQEIVARTHYLGKLKRRMYRAHVDTVVCPKPGQELFSKNIEPSQGSGKVVDACRHPKGGCELLAVVPIECAEGGTMRLGDSNGPDLEFAPLPYGFETPSTEG